MALDTGSLDTSTARQLADEAGIDLTEVEGRDPFPLRGSEVTVLPKVVDCVIEDRTGEAITLEGITVVSSALGLQLRSNLGHRRHAADSGNRLRRAGMDRNRQGLTSSMHSGSAESIACAQSWPGSRW